MALRIRRLVGTALLLAGIGALALPWLAPLLVERFVLPPLLAGLDLDHAECTVHRLDWRGGALRLRIKGPNGPRLNAASVRFTWSLNGLWQRHIEALEIDGLVFRPPASAGAPGPGTTPDQAAATTYPTPIPALPLSIGRILARDCLVLLPLGQQTASLPLEIEGEISAKTVRATLRVPDTSTSLSLAIDRDGDGRLLLKGDGQADAAALAQVLDIPQPLKLHGAMPFSLEAALTGLPLAVEWLNAELQLPAGLLESPLLHNVAAPTPSRLICVRETDGPWRIELLDLMLARPLKAKIAAAATLVPDRPPPSWQGILWIQAEQGQAIGPLHLDTASELALAFTVDLENGRLSAGGALEGKAVNLALATKDLTLKTGIQRLELRAALADGQRHADLDLGLRGAELRHHRSGLAASGADLDLALAWPLVKEGRPGRLAIKRINLKDYPLGRLDLEIRQQDMGLLARGRLLDPLVPGLKLDLKAEAGLDEAGRLGLTLAYALPPSPLRMDKVAELLPGLGGWQGQATLTLEGRLGLGVPGGSPPTRLELRDCSVQSPDGKISIDKARVSIDLPELPRPRSAPRQQLHIGRLTAGRLDFSDLLLDFQLESIDSLFVERGTAKWCGGHLFTSGFRLRPTAMEIEIDTYGDRLNLAELLRQTGAAEATGEGSLNGRVPLSFRDNRLLVDNGFLFSTPGDKGAIRILNAAALTSSLPEDAAQLSPLHFASEALRDFEYNWAKLLLNSENGVLVMRLKVDGRPAHPLPFRYDVASGGFIRAGEGTGNLIDQPLRLDMNFNIPVNELLRFHKNLKPLLNQGKKGGRP